MKHLKKMLTEYQRDLSTHPRRRDGSQLFIPMSFSDDILFRPNSEVVFRHGNGTVSELGAEQRSGPRSRGGDDFSDIAGALGLKKPLRSRHASREVMLSNSIVPVPLIVLHRTWKTCTISVPTTYLGTGLSLFAHRT
jgi:hypothetical protein